MGKGGKRMSHIRRNMKEENSEYRPEQLLCAKIFRELLGKEYNVKTEYPVTLTPFDGLRPRGARTVLQANGWRVFDFSWFNMLELWDQKKHSEEDARTAIVRNFTLTGDF